MPISILLALAGAAAIVLGMLLWAASSVILRMSRGDIVIRPVDEQEPRDDLAEAGELDQEARAWGYAWVGMFECPVLHGSRIAVWQDSSECSYLCMYFVHGRTFFDFITIYEKQRSLTTSSTSDAHVLPSPPGSFVQSFPSADLEQQHRQHVQGDGLLRTRGFIARDGRQPFEMVLGEFLAHLAQHVRSRPLWPLIILRRFLIDRGRLGDRPLPLEQVEAEQLRRAA